VSEEPELSISEKNGRKITITGIGVALGLVANLVYGGMQWQHSHDVEANHEDRITKLEGMKADATAVAVVEQNSQIAKLIEVVQTDHDSIVALKAMFESESQKR
jgi:hypothetical protein